MTDQSDALMTSLLNTDRPPVFCPGCSHERVVNALDRALVSLGLAGTDVALVSDIGCSGLFDTFFHTHALHGLHGRALTYAVGLKLARPDLQVIVTMGDGGLGIGGAHLLAACRRNLDLTLLVLNNFNFGMTGGQFSATTPEAARVGSGFLNALEKPMDLCRMAAAAGAPHAVRIAAHDRALAETIAAAIQLHGFSVVDIWGICTGRYTRHNRLSPKAIDESLAALPPVSTPVEENLRPEYGEAYARMAADQKPAPSPPVIEARFEPPRQRREDVIILGSAGGRVITAGEILCLAGMSAGLHATQKNEYNITVLRGPSVSEVILSPDPIGYTGIRRPTVVLALTAEGVARRRAVFEDMASDGLVIRAAGVEIPPCPARLIEIDPKAHGIRKPDVALAGLAALAASDRVIRPEMLRAALSIRFSGTVLESASALADRILDLSF